MSTRDRIVVKEESSRSEVARGYYLRLDWPLAYQPSRLTKVGNEPLVIPSDPQLYNFVPAAKLELSVVGTMKTLVKINGVQEVRVYPTNSFLVVLSVGYDWIEVDPVVLETIAQSLELGEVDRVDYNTWRRHNLPVSISPLDSVEYKASLNRQNKLIERLIKNSTEEMAEVELGDAVKTLEDWLSENDLPTASENAFGETIVAKFTRAQNRDLVREGIEKRQAEAASEAAKPEPEITARMWPEDYPPGTLPPPTLCSD